ncbi:MAG: hypothetical protein U9Q99_03355, partial [Nanoarchaeota archaeon]|nr:hypothetical protein [Nanoarchaeota archaeon]
MWFNKKLDKVKKFFFTKNSRGQVGDSLSWIIATIVIVVLILFFVFGSSLFAETKNVQKKSSTLEKIDLGKEDIFLKKSVFSLFSEIGKNNEVVLER